MMKSHRGLAGANQKRCAQIPFDECLCGKAASSKKIVFAERIDDRHEISYEGMAPHGHYCVPILFAGKTLGVINLYLQEGHTPNQADSTGNPPATGIAKFPFTVTGGKYKVLLYVFIPTDNDSLWVRMPLTPHHWASGCRSIDAPLLFPPAWH